MRLAYVVHLPVVVIALCAGPAVARGQAEVGKLQKQIDSIVIAALDEGLTPSYAVGVQIGDDVVVAKGYGLADLENEIPASSETVYRIGSLTKQFTAVSIMQLVELGVLRLDDDLASFIPSCSTGGQTVTIHQLLTHTGGFGSYTRQPLFDWKSRLDLTHEEVLELINKEALAFVPGAAQRYSNSGYYLLGMIIEVVSGQSYPEYTEQHLFRPLSMRGSSYCHEKPIIPHRAEGYTLDGSALVNDEPISMFPPGAAGGLCSTVLDLLRWQQALSENRLVTAASLRRMATPTVLSDGSMTPFGYGLVIIDFRGHRKIAHRGGISGFSSALAHYPDDDLTIVILANSDEVEPPSLEGAIARMILGIEQ
jgi:CubicO group peptidase (beta-lactamase class C family)